MMARNLVSNNNDVFAYSAAYHVHSLLLCNP
jgi:hypothetical protein